MSETTNQLSFDLHSQVHPEAGRVDLHLEVID